MMDQTGGNVATDGKNAESTAQFTPAYRIYAVLMLMTVFAVNVVDRNVLIMLLEPIKRELSLSDTQIGFLTGISFAIFYVIMGIPIAMLADRRSRRNIIVVALLVFSGMTVLSGLAKTFTQLLLARVFVAVGEAGTTPASHSMISDMFPPEKRASALGIYSLGGNLGLLGGFLIGGWINQWFGWRSAFFVVGLPGVLLALVTYVTLKEPVRGRVEGLTVQGASVSPDLLEVFRHLWSQKSFRHLMSGVTAMGMSNFALVIWFPAFLARSYHMSSGEAGTALALTLGLVSGIGTLFGGYLVDHLGKRDIRWNLWFVGIVNLLSFPFCVAMYLVNTKMLVLILFLYPSLIFYVFFAPTIAMTHALVPVRMRAQASAIFLFILCLVGQGIGPQLVGILSDLYRPSYGEESLRYALLTMPIFLVWAFIHFLLGARILKEDIARVNY